MKAIPLAFVAVMAIAGSVRSQVMDTAASKGSPLGPVASPATPRILGKLQDGTPPPPVPPKPTFIVPATDVLAVTTHRQGGRTITLQRIKPIALPPPPEPVPAPLARDEAAWQERVAELRANQPEWGILSFGATVYHSTGHPPRTLVRYWPSHNGEPVSFWSSADFGLLSGIPSFTDSDGRIHHLLMMWSAVNLDRMAAVSASHARAAKAPEIPEFSEGPATFILIGNPPADREILTPIQSLHDLYNNELPRLKTAYEGRERARLQREAELKANPPRPKDMTVNYWRTEKPAQAKGGAK